MLASFVNYVQIVRQCYAEYRCDTSMCVVNDHAAIRGSCAALTVVVQCGISSSDKLATAAVLLSGIAVPSLQ